MENVDLSLVDWSRAQFALTAMYHWLFVPLTLGITFLIAFFETIYYRTGNEEWKKLTKFWMKLFGINFAIGVATGLILEFQFGTNWSNYSWFVGDIFGAPLAIEGIMAFFLETTFVAVMFFGWNKVSKKFHLVSTWLVAIGSNLSALWILVANGWMQNPVGMEFNPDTARNEMVNFWEVLFNPMGINKFYHTVLSGYVMASVFVIGVSAWFLIKKREQLFAKRSMKIASIFGLISSVLIIITGDGSARNIAKYQPMKFAVMENIYEGQNNAPFTLFGFFGETEYPDSIKHNTFSFKIQIPGILSLMAFHDFDSFIPGIKDLVKGNPQQNILSYKERSEKGLIAINALSEYKKAKKAGNDSLAAASLVLLKDNFKHFGYGYYNNRNMNELVPTVPLVFYSFRFMVGLGIHFMILFIFILLLLKKGTLENKKLFLKIVLWSIPLAYLSTMLGWVVAEVGRQPWVIQDIMPTIAAVSQVSSSSVKLTFVIFAVIFTGLLIAEIKIMVSQIKKGPEQIDSKN